MKKILLMSLLFASIYSQGTFSGVTYFDYTYDLAKDATNDAGFGLNRVYFTYQKEISDGISYKFQTDVGQLEVFDDVDVDVDGEILVSTDKTQFVAYLKKAQLDWKSPIGKLTFGMQGMNMFNVTEKTWGFRFLQKSAMDKYKFSSSADLGIGLSGKLFDNISYSVMYTNGTGYKASENDKHKKISIQLVHGEKKLVKKDGFNAGTSFSVEPYDFDETTIKNKIVTSIYGGYAGNGLRIGTELDTHTDEGNDITQQIIAAYASYKLSEKLESLVYFDMYDPDISKNKDENTDMIIGFNYRPAKGLTMTPNMRMSTPEEGEGTTIFMLNFEFKF
tara:strand:+ start:2770 stop:3768 length:999 start_codon:yes stop_codon:yes gene_type:complete